MRSPSPLHLKLRSLLAIAVVAAMEACGGGDGPLDPAAVPAVGPATEATAEGVAATPVPADGLAALTTSQRIAFVSWASIQNIYSLDPQGLQLVPIFTQSDGVKSPAWSWDNKHLAMVRTRWNNGVWHNDIWVVNPDGSSGHWARSQASVWHFTDPTWSPDGTRIVMTVSVAGVPTLGWIELATSKAGLFYFPQGGAIRGTRPSYNKAGNRILYVGEHFTTIEQINADGSNHKVRISGTARLDYPSFSPDGGRIAYEKGPDQGNTDIFVRNIGTGTTTRLTWTSVADRHPSWSPDGTRLAFMSARSGKDQIYTMKASTGGDVFRVTHQEAYMEEPAWTH